MRQIDARRRHDEPPAVGQGDDADVEAARQQIVTLLLELLQQRAADVADADDGQREALARLEKRLMNRVERAHLLRRVDHARDVALRRALRDRADVDVVPAERVEHLPRDAGPALHPLADDGENRLVGLVVDDHQPVADFVAELLLDRLDAARRVGAAHGKADRVLGRGLRDQDDVDALGRQGPEQPFRDPRHADHARAAQRQQRQAADRRDALGQRLPGSPRLLEMSVPGAAGLNVFLIRIGMRLATAGAIVAEWSTFAPKYDSSIASS